MQKQKNIENSRFILLLLLPFLPCCRHGNAIKKLVILGNKTKTSYNFYCISSQYKIKIQCTKHLFVFRIDVIGVSTIAQNAYISTNTGTLIHAQSRMHSTLITCIK